MKKVMNRNLNDIIDKRFPGFLSKLKEHTGNTLELQVEEKSPGMPVPVAISNERRQRVHSSRDPVREAARFVEEPSGGPHDLFVIFGFGFGYHVEELLRRVGPHVVVLVIEKHPAMISAVLEHRNLESLFSDERFFLLVNPGEDELSDTMKGRASRKVSLLFHRGSVVLDEEYYQNSAAMVKGYLSIKEVNIATLAKFEKLWGSNIARNISTYVKSPGTETFYDRFSDYDALVVGAGPSLPEMVPWLREVQDSVVLIAVDTVLRFLITNDIEPHFCLSVDPQVINARYLEGMTVNRTILVGEVTVHPAVYRFFNGRVVTTGIAFDLLKWIERLAGSKGEITHGGSVSTNAADFARRLGVKTIYLAGQDLAFSNGRAHMKGSYFEELQHTRTGRTKTVEMFNRGQLYALPRIMVPAVGGGQVHTNQKMMVFLNWFSRQPLPLVNLTPRGAQIAGIKEVDYNQVTFRGEGPVSRFVNAIWQGQGQAKEVDQVSRKFLDHIKLMEGELDELIPRLEEGISLSGKLEDELTGQHDQGKIHYLLKKMSQVDGHIENSRHVKDMISFASQRVIHTITEGYDLDDASGDEADTARKSRFLYQGLLEGALFNRKVLNVMKSMLEHQPR